MDCQKIKELLTTREDASTLPEVVSHAAQCPTCKQLLRAEDHMNRGFRALASVPVRADLTGSVLRKINKGPGVTGTGAGSLSPKLLAVGAAIVGLVTLCSLFAIFGDKKDVSVKPTAGSSSGASFTGAHPPSTAASQPAPGTATAGTPIATVSSSHFSPTHPAASPAGTSRPSLPPSASLSAPVAPPTQPPTNE